MDLVEPYLAAVQRHDRRLADIEALYQSLKDNSGEKSNNIDQLQLETQHHLQELIVNLLDVRKQLSVATCKLVAGKGNLSSLREELAKGAARAQVARDEAIRRRHQLKQRHNFWRIKLRHLIEETRALKSEIQQRGEQVSSLSRPKHLLLCLMRCNLPRPTASRALAS